MSFGNGDFDFSCNDEGPNVFLIPKDLHSINMSYTIINTFILQAINVALLIMMHPKIEKLMYLLQTQEAQHNGISTTTFKDIFALLKQSNLPNQKWITK